MCRRIAGNGWLPTPEEPDRSEHEDAAERSQVRLALPRGFCGLGRHLLPDSLEVCERLPLVLPAGGLLRSGLENAHRPRLVEVGDPHAELLKGRASGPSSRLGRLPLPCRLGPALDARPAVEIHSGELPLHTCPGKD